MNLVGNNGLFSPPMGPSGRCRPSLLHAHDAAGVFTAAPHAHPSRARPESTLFEALAGLEHRHNTSPLGAGGMALDVVAA